MKHRNTYHLIALFFVFAVVTCSPVQAAIYGGYSEYYIPGREEQMFTVFSNLAADQGGGITSGPGMRTVISITATGDDTTVYYDHWEDGYEFDPADPDNTYDLKQVLDAGEVLELEGAAIPCAPRGTATYFDGGDRLYVAGTSVTVSRTSWPEDSGPNLAISWELFPIKPFLTDYTIPVGEDLAAPTGSYNDFSRTYVLVQSVADNNVVQIDDPTTGAVDVVVTLDKGETTELFNINAGTHVKGQLPVQVHFIVGRVEGYTAYEARGFNAMPDSMWDNIYFSPVSSQGGADVDLYLYNPHTAQIIVQWADTGGNGSFTIPAKSTLSYEDGTGHFVPAGSGVFLRSDNIFWGIGSSDTESRTFDWGYSLVPRDFLTDEYFLSWAPGTSDPTPGDNGSPAYVTAVFDETEVFVDFSPTDDTIDVQYTLDQLDSQKIFDPDNDNTGMHIWATGPLAVAWGQDADAAGDSNPYLDLGTANLPMPSDWIDLTLGIEKTADPTVLPPVAGSETVFTLVIQSYDFPVADIVVFDLLPPGFGFKNNSTTITFPDGTQKSGSAANPIIIGQLVTWGNTVLDGLDMAANETLTLEFHAVIDGTVDVDTYSNTARARGTRLEGSQVFSPFDSAAVYVTALTIDKDTTTPSISAGGTATFTIKLENISADGATNVTIDDLLASTDFSYDGGSDATLTLRDASDDSLINSATQTNDGSWNLPWTLGAGQYVVIEFDVVAAAGIVPGTYDSNAEAEFDWDVYLNETVDDKGEVEQDPGTPHGEDPEPDEDVIVNSLLINKTTSTPTVQAGGTAAYRIHIENAGNGAVTGVVITDELPDGFNFDDSSPPYTIAENSAPREGGWSEPADTDTNLTWGPWTINGGGSVTIDFEVRVPSSAAPGTYDNSAIVDSNETGLIDDAGTVGHWENDDPATGVIADAHTPTNDTEADEDVTVLTAVLQIDMDSITKYAVANGVSDGAARYQIKVLNVGSAGTQNTTITSNLLSGNFTYDAGSPATLTHYDSGGGVIATTTDTNDGSWTIPGGWLIGPDEYVVVIFDAVVDANTPVGIYDSDGGAAAIDDDGTVAYDSDTIPLEDPEEDEDVEVLGTPMADLAVSKTHTGDFDPDTTNAYSIVVTNKGPSVESNTVTVTDTLPVGLLYDSYSGGNWNCGAVDQVVTCTNTDNIAVGAALTTLTLNVTVDTANSPNSVTNQVAVASPTDDFFPENDTDQDITTIAMPDFSTSTKSLLDLNGGDQEPGDIIRYTIQLNESAGIAVNGVTVTDTLDVDFDRAAFDPQDDLVIPGGSSYTYDSGTGLLTVNGIDLEAMESAQIVFEVAIAGTASQGTLIENSATIINPDGRNETVAAPDLIVQASLVPAEGQKPLYLYENLDLSRTRAPADQGFVEIADRSTETWTLTPVSQAQIVIDSTSGTIPVILNVSNDDGSETHDITVTLGYTGASNGTIGSLDAAPRDLNETIETIQYDVPITVDHTLDPGTAITVSVYDDSGNRRDPLWVFPSTDVGGQQVWSRAVPTVNTVINVDSVLFYDAAYPGGNAIANTLPGNTVWVRADVSDPFGSADITGATVDIIDPEGTVRVNDAAMVETPYADPASKIYEYEYTIPADGPVDFWTASVTGEEGDEDIVSHTGVGVINVTTVSGADLAISKSHAGTFFRNSNGNFTLNVTNHGPEDQTANVVVRDTIPAGLTYVSSSGSDWAVDISGLPEVVWTYAELPVVAGTNLPPITLTVNVDATAPGTIQNTATIFPPGVGENNPSNDSSTDTIYIVDRDVVKQVDAISPYYDGDITKPDDLGTPTDNILTYSITVSNYGAGPMDNIEVTDPVPAGTTYIPGSSLVTAPAQVIRVTEYYISSGFTGTSYDLVLNQDLVPNYFVIVQGSDGDGATRGPDENYIALTGDPMGTGDLVDTDPVDDNGTILRFTRHGNVNDWEGVITVVEALRDHSGSGFLLRDVARVAHSGTDTTGNESVTSGWSDINQVMLLGGFNGAGCDISDTDADNHNSAHARIWPTNPNTINWSRNAGGETLQTATSTVMVIEWGTGWNVQRVRVQGNSGGNGADEADEYDTAAITGVSRDNTWVWGTGHTDDNGIGDAGEGVLVTLGDDFGVADPPPGQTETQAAVGIEYSQNKDFEVYALTHPNLAVDYRFKADGDRNSTTYNQPIDSAAGNRMALISNGSNGTSNRYPRSIWSARYSANDNILLERRYSGENWPAWVQGIDFSGIVSSVSVPGGDPPNLVTAADAYSLLPGQSLTVTFDVLITDATLPASITNTASVTSDQTTEPSVASVITEVRTLGVPNFIDDGGDPVTEIDISAGEPVIVRVVDLDRNEDPTAVESIQATVSNPDTGDSIVVTLYETGADTGEFINNLEETDPGSNLDPGAIDTTTVQVLNTLTGLNEDVVLYETGVDTGVFGHDSYGRNFGEVWVVPCADPSINCCNDTDGCATGITPPTAEETLYVAEDTDPDLVMDYADPADAGRDFSSTQVYLVATRVTLSDFGAFTENGHTVVFWETASEVGTAAFNLLRLDEATGTYQPVNERPVPSLRAAPQGGFYRLVDLEVGPGDWASYRLEEIEVKGTRNLYGPFEVTVGTAPEKITALGAMTVDFHRDAHSPNGLLQPVISRAAFSRTLAALSPGDAVKISVSSEGFYYLGAAQIAGLLGWTEADVSAAIGQGELVLSRSGGLVPYLPAAADAGLFFYGTPIDSLYTDTNVYWLRPGIGLLMEPGDAAGDVTGTGGVDAADVATVLKTIDNVDPSGLRPDYTVAGVDVNGDNQVDPAEALYAQQVLTGLRIPADSGNTLQPAAAPQSFRAILHQEENLVPLPDYFTDPTADYWIWGFIEAEGDEIEVNSLADLVGRNDMVGGPIYFEGWNGQGPMDLTIRLFGASNAAADVDHHVVVTINGVPVGEALWGGLNAHTLEITGIDPAVVGYQNFGADFFTLQAVLDDGVALSTVALDSITAGYPRTTVVAPTTDRLALRGDNHAAVTVSGFSSAAIQVLDVANPDRPRIIEATRVDDSAGDYRVTFAPFTPTAPYYAVVPVTAVVPDAVTAVSDTDLKEVGNAYDYLVIAPADFATAAQALVDHRTTQGLAGRVVALEEIIDGFNYGIPGPESIRTFLQYAYQHWQQAPRYVVLAGNGTYDYKNALGLDDNKIPALMMGTPDGLFASDQLLADVIGDDGVPDLAIGRLPVTSSAELGAMIERIKAFEAGSGDWRQNTLMVAGSPEHPGETNNFKTDSLGVAALLPDGLDTGAVYQDDGGTHLDVVAQMNAGALLVNYIGHGGYDRLAGAGLLTLADIPALTNASQRPVLSALTCIVGNFALPGFDTLGEALVKWPAGGTIAVWAPSGLSINEKAVRLNQEFARRIARGVGEDVRLGDLVLGSLRAYYQSLAGKRLVGLYNLLGDPALVMPLADLSTTPD